MAERGSHIEAERKASGGQALVQIGHYVLGETLGIGTFGKVKGKSLDIICQNEFCNWRLHMYCPQGKNCRIKQLWMQSLILQQI